MGSVARLCSVPDIKEILVRNTLRYYRAVAERAVKIAAMPILDNFKSFGHAVYLHVPG
jgi:hypothetical protein